MTIEQAIMEFRTPTVITSSGTQFDEDCLQLAEWLEELKTLRVELEKNSKELEETKNELKVIRKAFELACRKVGGFECCLTFDDHTCDNYCGTHFQEYFLQKAREKYVN